MLMGNLRNSFALVGVSVLCGCQFLGNLHLTHNSRSNGAATHMAVIIDASFTQEGRDHLRGNRNGMAIDAFNRALGTGEDPAAAYNGLGVAYARIGRPDLAYRFFKKAVMSDPSTPAYAHNLASLVDTPAFTLDLITRANQAPVPAQQAAASLAIRPAAAARVPGRLYRDDNRQFSLITVVTSQQTASADLRNASRSDCVPRSKRPCGLVVLPKTQSRNAKPGRVALTVPHAASPIATATTSSQSGVGTVAPSGKRKTVELSGHPQVEMPMDKAELRQPAAPFVAT